MELVQPPNQYPATTALQDFSIFMESEPWNPPGKIQHKPWKIRGFPPSYGRVPIYFCRFTGKLLVEPSNPPVLVSAVD